MEEYLEGRNRRQQPPTEGNDDNNNNAEGNLEAAANPKPQRRPVLVIDLPPWLGELSKPLSRGIKMLLMTMVVVAAVGSVVFLGMSLPSSDSSSSTTMSAATTHLDSSQVSDIVAHSTNTDVHSYGAAPTLAAVSLMRKEMIHFANVDTPLVMGGSSSSDVPFFLHVPRSEGTKVMAIMGKCMGLVQVTHLSTNKENDPFLMEQTDSMSSTESIPLINTKIGVVLDVDTYSDKGLQSAAEAGLLRDDRFDVLDSPLLYDVAHTLFRHDNTSHKRQARLFLFLRHPVERIISYFYHHVQRSSPLLALRAYAEQPQEQAEFNYLTKMLSNRPLLTPSHEITSHDVQRAKQVLKQKILVGLLEDKETSLRRLEAYFGWSLSDDNNQNNFVCSDEIQQWYQEDTNDVPQLNADDLRWTLVFKRNLHDMDLYEYAKNIIYKEQAQMF